MSFPANSSASYLAVSSRDDPENVNPSFNPCDFAVSVPNSIKLQDVVRVALTSASVPRMMANITPANNTLYWWQRAIFDYPYPADPTMNYRSVNPNWILTDFLKIPTGLYDVADVLALINTHRGPNEVWSVTSANPPSVQINTTVVPPVGPQFGLVPVGTPIPPPGLANITYVTAVNPGNGSNPYNSGIFSFLGVGNPILDIEAFNAFQTQNFDYQDPNTFASTSGLGNSYLSPYQSTIAAALKLPLFDATVFNYTLWSTTNYQTPTLLPPNATGPRLVYVTLTDLGDSSTVYARSGTTYDVITAVSMNNVQFGESAYKEVKDGEFEGIGLKQPRNITGFRVRVVDDQFNQMYMYANFDVNLRLQLVYISR